MRSPLPCIDLSWPLRNRHKSLGVAIAIHFHHSVSGTPLNLPGTPNNYSFKRMFGETPIFLRKDLELSN